MNSRGFTLIELIITIALLSMLFSLIATNMVSLQNRQLEGNYVNYKTEIEGAACLFIDSKDAGEDSVFFTTPSFSPASAISGGSPENNREACISNGVCYVKTRTLLDLGYLSKDLKNPTTGANVTDGEVVVIKYVDGEKDCLYYSS